MPISAVKSSLVAACAMLGATLAGGSSALASGAQAPVATPAPSLTPPPAAAAAAAWMAANAKQPGVVTLPSGVQYKVVTSGPKGGPSPKAGDIIKVHYEGKLTNGTVFDSSFQRGKAAIMPLDGLIDGWIEALPKMKVGDEWTLFIPPENGYGDRDMGEIPPYSVLVFRLQLVGMLAVD